MFYFFNKSNATALPRVLYYSEHGTDILFPSLLIVQCRLKRLIIVSCQAGMRKACPTVARFDQHKQKMYLIVVDSGVKQCFKITWCIC